MQTGTEQTATEQENALNIRRLVVSLRASYGQTNLLMAVCDRPTYRDEIIREYEAELGAQGVACYRVQLDGDRPSLKQSLLDLVEREPQMAEGLPQIVTVMGADTLLDLRFDKLEKSAQEKLLFSLQWTREALRSFEFPIVLWMTTKLAGELGREARDFWSWRGGVFEFVRAASPGTNSFGSFGIEPPVVRSDDSRLGKKALKLQQEIAALIAEDADSPLLGSLYQSLGFVERDRGDWDAAEHWTRAALTIHERTNNRQRIALCWGVLGNIARNRGNWDEAERLYRQYQQVCEELGDRSGMATSWGVLGDIARNRGNWDEAERLYRQSLQLREELGDRSGMASSWELLGFIASKRGNWEEAERLYRQSLQVREELGDRSGMASSWGVLGDIARNRGNWDEAERLYRQSLQVREELGDRSGMATSIGCLGEVEMLRGNLEQALPLLQQSLQQVQELGDPRKIAEANWDLARLEIKRHNPAAAQTHYTTAHTLYTQLGAAKDLEKIEQEWNALE
jgi:tetratricopeptide (TPR) repeat protein